MDDGEADGDMVLAESVADSFFNLSALPLEFLRSCGPLADDDLPFVLLFDKEAADEERSIAAAAAAADTGLLLACCCCASCLRSWLWLKLDVLLGETEREEEVLLDEAGCVSLPGTSGSAAPPPKSSAAARYCW